MKIRRKGRWWEKRKKKKRRKIRRWNQIEGRRERYKNRNRQREWPLKGV